MSKFNVYFAWLMIFSFSGIAFSMEKSSKKVEQRKNILFSRDYYLPLVLLFSPEGKKYDAKFIKQKTSDEGQKYDAKFIKQKTSDQQKQDYEKKQLKEIEEQLLKLK